MTEEQIKQKAKEAIEQHPFPDEEAHFYPPSAVTDISRRSWVSGYKQALEDISNPFPKDKN